MPESTLTSMTNSNVPSIQNDGRPFKQRKTFCKRHFGNIL